MPVDLADNKIATAWPRPSPAPLSPPRAECVPVERDAGDGEAGDAPETASTRIGLTSPRRRAASPGACAPELAGRYPAEDPAHLAAQAERGDGEVVALRHQRRIEQAALGGSSRARSDPRRPDKRLDDARTRRSCSRLRAPGLCRHGSARALRIEAGKHDRPTGAIGVAAIGTTRPDLKVAPSRRKACPSRFRSYPGWRETAGPGGSL